MKLSPDEVVLWQAGVVKINHTLLFTWLVAALLVGVSWLVSRHLTAGVRISPWQNLLEAVVDGIRTQIREVTGEDPRPFLPLIGTLFLFIVTCNVLAMVPGFEPPTGSLSTTAALALCVFFAVPVFGIREQGVWGYLKTYFQPTPLLFPFHVLSEITRTLALAVRLFGNVMSGTMIAAILLAVAPLFFPAVMRLLELITGVVQAYIFAVLALVYISSASRAHGELAERPAANAEGGPSRG